MKGREGADFDAIIIGGGPAGLTAGLYLSRGRNRTLLIDKDGFGGNIKNADWIENYPGFSDGVAGPQLASEMTIQAVNSGLQMEMAEVAGIESYSESTCVQLTDGRYFTSKALIIASGCRPRKLNVPGESELQGKGVFDCALCDGGQFYDKTVVVCGRRRQGRHRSSLPGQNRNQSVFDRDRRDHIRFGGSQGKDRLQ